MPQTDDIMTVAEVAKLLKLKPGTIYKLSQSGEIPSCKIGGSWRYSRKAIESWLVSDSKHLSQTS